MKTVHVTYYAIFREKAGRTRESVTGPIETAKELFEILRLRHGFELPIESLRVAANSAFTSLEYALRDGDEIVFIPPVAGG